jgi:hypothetical protein
MSAMEETTGKSSKKQMLALKDAIIDTFKDVLVECLDALDEDATKDDQADYRRTCELEAKEIYTAGGGDEKNFKKDKKKAYDKYVADERSFCIEDAAKDKAKLKECGNVAFEKTKKLKGDKGGSGQKASRNKAFELKKQNKQMLADSFKTCEDDIQSCKDQALEK